MLEVGNQVPEARVQTAPGDETTIARLAGERPALFLFYLFDWSST